MDLYSIISTLTDWVVAIARSVDGLDPTVAFALGAFTWFLVDKLLARIMSWMKWAILLAVLAALGLSIPQLTGIIRDGVNEQPNIELPDLGTELPTAN